MSVCPLFCVFFCSLEVGSEAVCEAGVTPTRLAPALQESERERQRAAWALPAPQGANGKAAEDDSEDEDDEEGSEGECGGWAGAGGNL